MRHSQPLTASLPQRRSPALPAFVATLLALGSAATAPATPRQRIARPPPIAKALASGQVHERTIESGGTHRYRLELTAGQFLHVHADQQGADVVLELLDPARRSVVRVDTFTPAGDDEHEDLYAEITTSGPHLLVVSTYANADGDTGGDYTLRIAELRPLRPGDRERIEAEALYVRSVGEILDGELEAAEDTLIAAAQGFRRLGDSARWADAVSERCRVLYDMNLQREREAVDLCEPLVEAYRLQDRPNREARMLQILGHCDIALEKPERAIDRYTRALRIRQRGTDERALARSHQSLGQAYSDAEAFHEALLHYGQALRSWRRLGESDGLLWVLHSIGKVYLSLGRFGDARRSLEEALSLVPGDDPELKADVLVDLGLALHHSGLETESLAWLHTALTLQGPDGPAADRAHAMSAIGLVHGVRGRPRRALTWYLRALDELVPQGNQGRLHPDLVHNIAWDLHELGFFDTALPLFGRALAQYRELGERWAQARTLLGIARVERARGRPEGALEPLRMALALLEELRRGLMRPDLRIDYMAGRQDPYDFAIDLLMDLHGDRPGEGWDLEALVLVEHARARGLLDLVPAPAADRRPLLEPDLELLAQELADAVDAATFQLSRLVEEAADKQEIAAAEQRLTEHLDALRGLRAEIAHGRPGSAAGHQGKVVTGDALLGGLLGADDVLLVYKLGEERSFLWVVTAGDLATFELPPRKELEESARRAHELLRDPPLRATRSDLQRTLSELGSALLDPAAAYLDHRRLLVVPEGALLYLPFAALPSAGGREPVASRHEVVVLPSVSVLAALRRPRAPQAHETLAVIADPVFSAADPRITDRRIDEPSGTPPRLKHSLREAAAILSMAPVSGRVAALGLDARRAALFGDLIAEARYVHIATHVQIDPHRPELSRLVLTRIDPDGRPLTAADLFAHEIFSLDLAADLVTLSACDTALGQEVRGEGLVGFAHGFFHAGASGLLLALWPVDDEATAELMIRFYGHLLGGGRSPATALRAAQLEIAAQRRWADRYYWAGFVLIGEGVPVPLPGAGPAGSSDLDPAARNADVSRLE